MDNFTQLESHSNELARAVRSLASYCRGADVQQSVADQLLIDSEAHKEVHRAKRSICANVARIKTLMCGPTDFLEHLASQVAILACLGWLGEFQILACIPLTGSVPIQDVADLSSVPEPQLCRIIRLTATVGFLDEPQMGHVAHTPLSASFVENPSFLDAGMFLAEFATPAALQMAPSTQRFGDSCRPNESAYNLAFNTTKPFHTARKERPKLSRQWSAYLHYAGGLHAADNVADILTQLNWSNISNACIVEMGGHSTSTAENLARLYPTLHFVVQMSESPTPTPDVSGGEMDSSRITVTNRAPGTRQTATNAAVYILHLASSPASVILAELRIHLGILRASSGIMLIFTSRLLPEPGCVSLPGADTSARARDLALLQLANEGEMEMVELLDMIDSVCDSSGKLVVINKLRSPSSLVAALVVKYQVCVADRGVEPRPV
ncbi:uncharacterized protein BCR38DRAFT_419679 [Pseudomassariella vexata]|uniref:O-methyltransferase domain-containing protein n=1 Tax=Pseudomassariella vexata TaxID=1141098 RepID=A0A1Y2EDI3_9PEZI|nr:uncharacterized protein BCR38DRAFT_419679 [Pseudomassariella vexata]ORY69639.1 hypothetical protein BCR38DRAFT_419679 [Pseudomassariella vexata]